MVGSPRGEHSQQRENEMTKSKIILVGAGGHCRSCIDVIEQEGRFEIAGVVDKDASGNGSVLGYPVIGRDEDLSALRQEYEYAMITVGQIKSSAVRMRLSQLLADEGFKMPVVVSPHAYVSPHATIGDGTIVMHGAIVNAGAKIGGNCILNSSSLIEHDAEAGDFVHISTGAIINGDSKVWNNSFVGSGAVVIHGITLPEYSFVRAGQRVVSNDDFKILEHS